MTIYACLGPTLTLDEARTVNDQIVYCPPVQQGQVYRLAEYGLKYERPRAIAIIDGYFQHSASVWHKEILWAMDQGIHVFGAASMGALRAAELTSLGMCGVGKVFQAYCDGIMPPYTTAFEDDDEVAIVHGPAETGYMAISEALVNIRCTLAAAAQQGLISVATRDALVAYGKTLFYPQRSYDALLQWAQQQDLPDSELTALEDWLPSGKIDQKREDAKALLKALRQPPAQCKNVDYYFATTTLWQRAVLAESTANLGPTEQTILEEVQLQPQRYDSLCREAVLYDLARQNPPPVEDEGLIPRRMVRNQFLRQHGLYNRAQRERWLREHDLQAADLERLFDDEVLLQNRLAGVEPREVLLQLKRSDDYLLLAARAKAKQACVNAEHNMSDAAVFKLLHWYFEQSLQSSVPHDLEAYIHAYGFASVATFYQALQREYDYVDEANANSQQEQGDD